MRANKHLHRLALIVRKENPNTKTKILIPSDELHPILSVKNQGEEEYKKIDERTLEIAKGSTSPSLRLRRKRGRRRRMA